jgi:hypothetical protein
MMKKLSIISTMLAVLLAFGFALVSCDNGSTNGGEPEPVTPGILRVTNIPSMYNGKYALFRYADGYNGQTFIWGIQPGSNPGEQHLILSRISNGSVDIPLQTAEGILYGTTETLTSRNSGNQMLRLFFFFFDNADNAYMAWADGLGVLFATFSSVRFVDGGATIPFQGTFTLKDIPRQYNGNYAIFRAIGRGQIDVWGYQGRDTSGKLILTKIENGRVVIPLIADSDSGSSWFTYNYTGNDTYSTGYDGGVHINFYEASSVESLNELTLLYGFIPSITFSNGSAVFSFNDLDNVQTD